MFLNEKRGEFYCLVFTILSFVSVHCEVGEWSEWGPCSRIGKNCIGEESRTRKVLQTPSPQGNPCPSTLEKRECVVKKKRCGKFQLKYGCDIVRLKTSWFLVGFRDFRHVVFFFFKYTYFLGAPFACLRCDTKSCSNVNKR